MEKTGAEPHTLECNNSKGECVVNWEVGKGSLCIFPQRQCVQDMLLHLLTESLNIGKRVCGTWAWGWPSLLCHNS